MTFSASTFTDRIGKKEIFIIASCLLIGFALRFYSFDKKSLWLDEIYTYQDSRDDLKGQIEFYKERPTYLHPPLFYILTHLFYPFPKPERDIRIIPLLFGTLSIVMLYFLAKEFSPQIALLCTVAFTFMTYHIALSQDGRSYTLLLFFGMTALYLFLRYLHTFRICHLVFVALFFAFLFHTSYSSVPFIALSQILWFYQPRGQEKRPTLTSFLWLNILTLFFCLPWISFILFHYRGQSVMDPEHIEGSGSLWTILYGVFHDWVPHWPLMIVSVLLFILLPLLLKNRRNGFVLLSAFVLPVLGLSLYCEIFKITHFVTSRYFINFLPLFLISLFLSLDGAEARLVGLKRFVRLKLLFLILFVASNLVILPLYYRSEKQDNRGLANYLKENLRNGDKVFMQRVVFLPGILHYFGLVPEGRRYYKVTFSELATPGGEYSKPITYGNQTFIFYYSKTCCTQYVADGSRVWIIVGEHYAREFKNHSPAVLKGYFDGSFLNFNRFPTDVSFYLFLWDPTSPNEQGIEMPKR